MQLQSSIPIISLACFTSFFYYKKIPTAILLLEFFLFNVHRDSMKSKKNFESRLFHKDELYQENDA